MEQGKKWGCNFQKYGQNRAHTQKMMEQRLEKSKRIQGGILDKEYSLHRKWIVLALSALLLLVTQSCLTL